MIEQQRERMYPKLSQRHHPYPSANSREELRRLAAIVEPRGARLRFEEDRERDVASPLDIIRWGVIAFFIGINAAAIATLVSTGLAFALAYIAAGALFLALLGFWRATGREIIKPSTLSLLLSLCLALAVTSLVAAVSL